MSKDVHEDLRRTYRAGARDEPPAWLDERILRAARGEAVRSRTTSAPAFASRWGLPLAMAAVVVLSVSVVLVMREEQNARVPSGPSVAADAERAIPPVAEAAKAAKDMASTALSAASTDEAPRQSDAIRVPATPTSPEAAHTVTSERHRQDHATAQGPASAEKATVLEDRAARVAPEITAVTPVEAPERRQAKERVAQAAEVPAAAPPAAAAESASTANRRDTRAEAVLAAPAARMSEAAPAAPPPAAGAVASRARGSTERPDAEAPERWLDRILLMRKQGRLAEAQVSLEEFRKRHPHYPLPDTLK